MAFPNNVLQLAHAASSNFLSVWFGGTVAHSDGDNLMIDHIIATQKRLGTGVQTAPARGMGLLGRGVADSDGNQQSIWDHVSRRNRVIGGSAQLWDQGTSPAAADNAYIGGNWRVLMEAANACTVTREASDLPTSGARWAWKVTAGSGNNNKFGLFCVLEGDTIWDLRSAAASLQAAIKIGGTLANMKMAVCHWVGTEDATTGDPISSWGADGVNPTLAANWGYSTTPVNLGASTSWGSYFLDNQTLLSAATNYAVFIWSDDKTTTQTTDYFLLTDVQLERGAVCTSLERRKRAEEAALDRWFYRVFGGDAAFQAFGTGLWSGTTTAHVPIQFDPMRATPTASVSAAGHFGIWNATATVQTATGVSFTHQTPYSVMLNPTVASGGAAGDSAVLLANNTLSARLMLGARI